MIFLVINMLSLSFDVTSLYTDIPIIDTLRIIKDYVNNDDGHDNNGDQLTKKTAILKTGFLI